MKAVRLHARGGPGQLVYEEAPPPVLQAGDALVRVHAAAITPTELNWAATYSTREGDQRLPAIPCHDVSGVVAAITPGVTDIQVDDQVYGLTDFWRNGAAATYVAVRAKDLAPKPPSLDHIQAAAVPLSALTAWQALFDHAGLHRGQRLLIHGAAGGVGVYAVQLARWRGAHIIGTALARDIEFLHDLGVDEIIDYTRVRFEERVKSVDVVLDTVGGETLERSCGVLRCDGVLVSLVGGISAEKAQTCGTRAVFFIVKPSRHQLIEISRLIEVGLVRPLVAAVFPLEQAQQAFEHALSNHTWGKTVLRVAE
jgi:NADPH:quinone reductase-like Zn-dependent oxidoreductase